MKKQLFILGLLLSLSAAAQKQTPKNLADSLKFGYWTRGTQFGINGAVSQFSTNWKGGGVDNTTLTFLFGHKADFTKGKGIWTNDVLFQYGFLNNKPEGQPEEFRKSLDRIFLDTKYARKINAKLNYFVNVNFISQFSKGLDPKANNSIISNFLAPGYLSEGLGLEYKPNKHLAFQLGGATLRQTFVSDKAVFSNNLIDGKRAFGIEKTDYDTGKRSLNEMGFNVIGTFNKDVMTNVNLKARYSGFLAYSPKKIDPNTRGIDHRIDVTATAKVNKYLNVNFTFVAIQDKDIEQDFQSSGGLMAGLLYTL